MHVLDASGHVVLEFGRLWTAVLQGCDWAPIELAQKSCQLNQPKYTTVRSKIQPETDTKPSETDTEPFWKVKRPTESSLVVGSCFANQNMPTQPLVLTQNRYSRGWMSQPNIERVKTGFW